MSSLQPLKLPKITAAQSFDSIDPLDGRYYDPEIARYLSERSRLACQAYVEAALAHALAKHGVCSLSVAKRIETASQKVTAEAVAIEEQVTRHDIKALVNCIKAELDDEASVFVHFGATSYDIVSTASALQLRLTIHELILPRLKTLIQTLIELSETYADTVQIGRTHGQHAVPITFGFMLSNYVNRLGENYEALRDLATMLPGKFSGAVGGYNALSIFLKDPLQFEKDLLALLDLKPAAASTQIVPAEYTVRIIDEMAIGANIMANLSHDMRHLQRSEIAEVRERFEPGQAGSSTMAHKRNPWNFENVISMSKQVTAQVTNANLNISSEHQRDLTDSASARFYAIVPACVASMTERLNKVMNKLEIDQVNMQRNLELSGGAIAAEPLYLLLAKYGHIQAYEVSKQVSQAALAADQNLAAAVAVDKRTSDYWQQFTKSEKQIIEHPEKYYTGLAAKKARLLIKKWSDLS